MEGKIFYYIDPMGPKNSIRGAYTAIKYVNMFATRYSSYNYNIVRMLYITFYFSS